MKKIAVYLALINLLTFAAYGIDKKIAQRTGLRDDDIDARRISEKALLLWALCGGALAVSPARQWP